MRAAKPAYLNICKTCGNSLSLELHNILADSTVIHDDSYELVSVEERT